MISYSVKNCNLRLKEILRNRGIKKSKMASYMSGMLEKSGLEMQPSSTGRWIREDVLPNAKNLDEVLKGLEMTDSEAAYYLLGIEYSLPVNLPDFQNTLLTMKVFASMDEHFKKNGVHDLELGDERLMGIFTNLMAMMNISKNKIIDPKLVEAVCRA